MTMTAAATAQRAFIDLARDFHDSPIGRFKWQGRHSGEAFRDDHLWPALQRHTYVTVDLDGASALSTGFLDEAFAGLVREGRLSEADFWRRVDIVCTKDPLIVTEIRSFVSKEARRHRAH